MSAESVYAVAAPRNGTTASKVVTTPSAQSEKAMPSNGDGWMGVGSVSNGSIEAKAKIQAPLGEAQVFDLLPGHSAQKPLRLVPALTNTTEFVRWISSTASGSRASGAASTTLTTFSDSS